MDSKGAASNQTYEDFVPTTELVQEQDSDILLIHLTGDQSSFYCFFFDRGNELSSPYIVFRVIFC